MYIYIFVRMYVYICIHMHKNSAFPVGRREFARGSVGTSFICLKDVVKDIVILAVLSEMPCFNNLPLVK